ncbi:MAG: PEP-CTERM sorting domain-containing protein [Thermoguttaceae bacterium]
MMRYLVILSSVFLVLACTSVAMAQIPGIGDKQTTPSWQETINVGGGSTVDVGSVGNPVGIYLDPNAGPWQKTFANFVAPLTINEAILIGAAPGSNPPGPPWSDWEEQILSAGWVWAGGASLSVLGDGVYNGNLSADQKTVEFDFPAQAPGTTLVINKVLQWNGVGNPILPVTVNEYPTPEPATIVLLISGLLALGLGYIRRR